VVTKRKRVRAFCVLLYAVAALEAGLAPIYAIAGPAVAGLPWLLAALVTGVMTRAFWRGFEKRGEDHWFYSWRGTYRRLRR